MMNNIPRVTNPNDVLEILDIMKNEYFSLLGIDERKESEHFLRFYFVPAYISGSGSYGVINNFKLILDGASALCKSGNDKVSTVSVLELVVNEGNMDRHSYIVTPIDFRGIFSNMGKELYSYFFLEPATSGYSGTGPDIQRAIQEMIDNSIPKTRQKESKVNSVESLIGLFYEDGPIVNIFFPTYEIPKSRRDYDERFMRP